ncbi:MAG: ABC transporter ATP-binding protein [Polyangiaceae bacterium]|nr:ABC transporter ATP-binding protein [Polyangiaceae bacterium]
MSVVAERLFKRIGKNAIVTDVSFEARAGELVGLLGPSGGGKSTVLRMIAGLEEPDEGEIYLCGKRATDLPVQERGIGFVFQGYALFKHQSIAQNIAFGLEVRKVPKAEIDRKVGELLALVELSGFGARYPSELSGGQRQRVALARAIAPDPRVLLLDEPFGALDAKVRLSLREQLRRLTRERNMTVILVTHDQEEAMDLADRVIVLHRGRVEQAGTPHEIYDHPATEFVASFVGATNVLRGEVRGGRTEIGTLQVDAPPGDHEGRAVTAIVRPHDIEVSKHPDPQPTEADSNSNGPNLAAAKIERLSRVGPTVKVRLKLEDGQSLTVELTKERAAELNVVEGDWVFVNLRETKIFVQDYAI